MVDTRTWPQIAFSDVESAVTEAIEIVDANAVAVQAVTETPAGASPPSYQVEQGNDRQNWSPVGSAVEFSGATEDVTANIGARYVRLRFSFSKGAGQAVVSFSVETKSL